MPGAADRVALHERDAVQRAVRERGRDSCLATTLPVLVPAASERVPVRVVAGCSAMLSPVVIPRFHRGIGAGVVWGVEDLEYTVQAVPLGPPGLGSVSGDQRRLVQILLLQVGHQEVMHRAEPGGDAGESPIRALTGLWEAPRGLGQFLIRVVTRVDGNPDLLEIVRTLNPGSGLADLLHRRK